jgi:hypothetical protein
VWYTGEQHIMDMLEKRVKSRFSDRYILFLPNASMEQAIHILRYQPFPHTRFARVAINELLMLSASFAHARRHVLLLPEGFSDHPHAKEWNSRVAVRTPCSGQTPVHARSSLLLY